MSPWVQCTLARPFYIVLLGIAVINVSFASIIVRLLNNEGVHGFVAASWRLILGAMLTLAIHLIVEGKPGLPEKKDLLLMALSGVSLALHFDLWMLSLSYTSVAVSVTIVDSYPALLALIGTVVLGENYNRLHYTGALLAMIGVALLSLSQYGYSEASFTGAILAFGGMLGVAAYFTIGRVLRARYSTLTYTLFVYTAAALVSTILTLAHGLDLTGYTSRAYLLLALLALVPMLGGHTLLNYIIKRLSLLATTVPVLGEPIGASILAYIILGETIPLQTLVFMAITLAGILITLLGEYKVTTASPG